MAHRVHGRPSGCDYDYKRVWSSRQGQVGSRGWAVMRTLPRHAGPRPRPRQASQNPHWPGEGSAGRGRGGPTHPGPGTGWKGAGSPPGSFLPADGDCPGGRAPSPSESPCRTPPSPAAATLHARPTWTTGRPGPHPGDPRSWAAASGADGRGRSVRTPAPSGPTHAGSTARVHVSVPAALPSGAPRTRRPQTATAAGGARRLVPAPRTSVRGAGSPALQTRAPGKARGFPARGSRLGGALEASNSC